MLKREEKAVKALLNACRFLRAKLRKFGPTDDDVEDADLELYGKMLEVEYTCGWRKPLS